MTLEEVECLTGSKVVVTSTLRPGFSASLERCESLDGAILSSCVGFGSDSFGARAELARCISGSLVVKNAYSVDRQEFNLTDIDIEV